jgi:hypothetical protein
MSDDLGRQYRDRMIEQRELSEADQDKVAELLRGRGAVSYGVNHVHKAGVGDRERSVCETCGTQIEWMGSGWRLARWPILGFQYDTPVDEAIGIALGAASMCWEHPQAAGVFDSQRAAAISEELLSFIRYKVLGDLT